MWDTWDTLAFSALQPCSLNCTLGSRRGKLSPVVVGQGETMRTPKNYSHLRNKVRSMMQQWLEDLTADFLYYDRPGRTPASQLAQERATLHDFFLSISLWWLVCLFVFT